MPILKHTLLATLLFLALSWAASATAQISKVEAMRRDAELNQWMNDATLSNALRDEAARVQSARSAVNDRGSRFGQMVQAHKLSGDQYNDGCTGRPLTQSERVSCNQRLASLKSERSRLDSEHMQLQRDASSVNADYKALRRDVQSHLAAQAGADQKSWHVAWSQGRQDAIDCSPVNAHGYCSNSGSDYASCQHGYSQGFADGATTRDQMLDRAYALGKRAAQDGKENSSFNHSDAQGACRTQWVQEFNRGYFEAAVVDQT